MDDNTEIKAPKLMIMLMFLGEAGHKCDWKALPKSWVGQMALLTDKYAVTNMTAYLFRMRNKYNILFL